MLLPIKKTRVLGAGAWGVVHLAHFEGHQNAKFAVKSAEKGEEEADSLEKEKRVYESLDGCPGITQYFMDATTQDPHDGLIYYNLLLDFAPAGTLFDIITHNEGCGYSEQTAGAYKGWHLTEGRVKVYAHQILVGLCSMHSKGYVHCDLKPANILAFPSRRGSGAPHELKLADFGHCKEPSDPLRSDFWKGRFRGTALYMSPESVKDGLISSSLDIWSLGCIVVQMLNGWEFPWPMPISDLLPDEFMDLLKDPEFDPLEFVPQSMSETGKSFLRKCLEKDPVKRWPAHLLLDHPFLADVATPVSVSDVRKIPDKGDFLNFRCILGNLVGVLMCLKNCIRKTLRM